MNKKDLLILFLPSVLLAFTAVDALLCFHVSNNPPATIRVNELRDSFEKFTTNVQSGKFQLTKEQMLKEMQAAEDCAQNEIYENASRGRVFQHIGIECLIVLVWQAVAVVIVRRRITKRQSTVSVGSTAC